MKLHERHEFPIKMSGMAKAYIPEFYHLVAENDNLAAF